MMKNGSRKERRKQQQSIGKSRSTQLLKTVLLPLLLLLTIVFLVYSISRSDKWFPSDMFKKKEAHLISDKKHSAKIYTWEEFIEAISNKELTEITIKKEIVFPKEQDKLSLNPLIKVHESKSFRYDDILKKEQIQSVLIVSLVNQKIKRKVLIDGEQRIIDFGRIELDLPEGLELEFKEVTLVRGYQY